MKKAAKKLAIFEGKKFAEFIWKALQRRKILRLYKEIFFIFNISRRGRPAPNPKESFKYSGFISRNRLTAYFYIKLNFFK